MILAMRLEWRRKHLGGDEVGELAEQHKGIFLSAQLRQAPPLPHRQRMVRRIVARPARQPAAQDRPHLRRTG